MSLRASPLALAVLVAFAGAAAFVACAPELPPPVPCVDIPAGGCPRRDNACVDPACAAVYVCQASGSWRLDRTCAARDASVAAEASVSDANVSPRDVSVDVVGAFGGPGCLDLAFPDCSLGFASGCPGSCCACEDVFVCESGAWTLWGRCDNGELIGDAR